MLLFDTYEIDLSKILLPIIYIVLGIVVYKIIKMILNKILNKNKLIGKNTKNKVSTVFMLISNIIKYLIAIIVILAILSVFGVNVVSIVAGLGVTAAVLGLALQDVAKDLISGITILTEEQYKLGDTIEIEGFMGEVIFVGLRSTRIKNYRGSIKIIANRNISNIINYSMENSLAIVDINISYDNDSEKIEKTLEKIGENIKELIPSSKSKLEVWGVENLNEFGYEYRVALLVKSMEQYTAQRTLRKEIKKVFDQEKIKFICTNIEVKNGK